MSNGCWMKIAFHILGPLTWNDQTPCLTVRDLWTTRVPLPDDRNEALPGMVEALDTCQLSGSQHLPSSHEHGFEAYLRIYSDHVTPLLQNLHWIKIQDRITFKILLLVYKAQAMLLSIWLTCWRIFYYRCWFCRLGIVFETVWGFWSIESGRLFCAGVKRRCNRKQSSPTFMVVW